MTQGTQEEISLSATEFGGYRVLPISPFRNEDYLDFTQPAERAAMQAALRAVEAEAGREYACTIAGQPVQSSEWLTSINPAQTTQVVGRHAVATAAMVDSAVVAAQKAFAAWSAAPMMDRVALLVRLSDSLRRRRYELCAWMTLEVGKNFGEADSEFAEAIDFLEFYAACALELDQATTPIQFPGERNQLRHVPLGVVAVIPPWNFPLAILAGMTAAAIVCGNTVVLKPSPDAPTIAAKLMELMVECGLPAGVVNLLQGGAEVGAAITSHKGIHAIAFTGSKAVGLKIHAEAAQVKEGQTWIKRTVLELGGKDGIVVMDDADLDLAAAGVAASAFGFSGQKCSACSRVIVHRAVHDAFVAKLLERVAALDARAPRENGGVAPVINAAAYERVLRYIEVGRAEGKLVAGGVALTAPEAGFFIAPTIFDEVPPTARIAQEEVFGPLLAVTLAEDFDDAMRIANDTAYGLTGAIYSGSAEVLERARREFHVGNLYLNRKCTGAMVGAHPFGGFKLSGTDSKAGGADYLHHFTQAKSIAERILG
jgi:1-pyrroline-5-carboxylate dehydrogenase